MPLIKYKAIFIQFLFYGFFGLFALFYPKLILDYYELKSVNDHWLRIFGLLFVSFSTGIYGISRYAIPDLVRVFLISNLTFPFGILIMILMGILPSKFQIFTIVNSCISIFILIELFINFQVYNFPRKSKLFVNTYLKFKSLFFEFLFVNSIGLALLLWPKTMLIIFDLNPVQDNWLRLTGLLLFSFSFNFYGFAKFGNLEIIKIFTLNALLFSLFLSIMIFLNFIPFNLLVFVIFSSIPLYFSWMEIRKYENNSFNKF